MTEGRLVCGNCSCGDWFNDGCTRPSIVNWPYAKTHNCKGFEAK